MDELLKNCHHFKGKLFIMKTVANWGEKTDRMVECPLHVGLLSIGLKEVFDTLHSIIYSSSIAPFMYLKLSTSLSFLFGISMSVDKFKIISRIYCLARKSPRTEGQRFRTAAFVVLFRFFYWCYLELYLDSNNRERLWYALLYRHVLQLLLW